MQILSNFNEMNGFLNICNFLGPPLWGRWCEPVPNFWEAMPALPAQPAPLPATILGTPVEML
jgi:hypothetical protein